MRSPWDLSFGHSSTAAPAAVNALSSASLRFPPKWTITRVRSGSGSLAYAVSASASAGGRLVHPGHDDQPVAAEEGRRQHVGELPHGQPGGGQLVLLRLRVALEHGGPDGRDRAGPQELLLPHDDAQP